MTPGLYIVSLPSGGYYPYTIVGWLRPTTRGLDEWEAVGHRIIRRYGRNASLAGLAANGPAADTQLLEPAKFPMPVLRQHMGRPERCDWHVWVAACPKPQDWPYDDD